MSYLLAWVSKAPGGFRQMGVDTAYRWFLCGPHQAPSGKIRENFERALLVLALGGRTATTAQILLSLPLLLYIMKESLCLLWGRVPKTSWRVLVESPAAWMESKQGKFHSWERGRTCLRLPLPHPLPTVTVSSKNESEIELAELKETEYFSGTWQKEEPNPYRE